MEIHGKKALALRMRNAVIVNCDKVVYYVYTVHNVSAFFSFPCIPPIQFYPYCRYLREGQISLEDYVCTLDVTTLFVMVRSRFICICVYV